VPPNFPMAVDDRSDELWDGDERLTAGFRYGLPP
jgi:hypothetical protein